MLDIMQRRELHNLVKLIRILREAKFCDPRVPNRKLMIAQHVGDRYFCKGTSKQVRSSVDGCCRHETSVTAALQRKMLLVSEALTLEELSRRKQIIKSVLPVFTNATLIPCSS